MTNLEAIREMEAEALACILMCPAEIDGTVRRPKDCNEKGCIPCTVEWLRKEVTEG